jgi:hypothetical protein
MGATSSTPQVVWLARDTDDQWFYKITAEEEEDADKEMDYTEYVINGEGTFRVYFAFYDEERHQEMSNLDDEIDYVTNGAGSIAKTLLLNKRHKKAKLEKRYSTPNNINLGKIKYFITNTLEKPRINIKLKDDATKTEIGVTVTRDTKIKDIKLSGPVYKIINIDPDTTLKELNVVHLRTLHVTFAYTVNTYKVKWNNKTKKIEINIKDKDDVIKRKIIKEFNISPLQEIYVFEKNDVEKTIKVETRDVNVTLHLKVLRNYEGALPKRLEYAYPPPEEVTIFPIKRDITFDELKKKIKSALNTSPKLLLESIKLFKYAEASPYELIEFIDDIDIKTKNEITLICLVKEDTFSITINLLNSTGTNEIKLNVTKITTFNKLQTMLRTELNAANLGIDKKDYRVMAFEFNGVYTANDDITLVNGDIKPNSIVTAELINNQHGVQEEEEPPPPPPPLDDDNDDDSSDSSSSDDDSSRKSSDTVVLDNS